MDHIPSCLKNKTNVAFAALNSSGGFLSYFDELFHAAGLERLIILKGGPGTGKSTLLFRTALRAESNGESVDYYLCSSDESSLDAVVLKERGLAIVDGTAPHTIEAKYPGAFEELFDTARFLDTLPLQERRSEIVDLCRRKKFFYSRAYCLLKTAGDLYAQANLVLSDGVDYAKLSAAAERQAKRLGLFRQKGPALRRQMCAFGGSGKVELSAFRIAARHIYRIGDFFGHGAAYLECLFESAKRNGAWVEYSCNPLSPSRLSALHFPGAGVCFYVGDEERSEEETVNFLRFLFPGVLREKRSSLRFLGQTVDGLLNGSAECFGAARRTHAELESVYAPSMDFEALSDAWEGNLNEWFK